MDSLFLTVGSLDGYFLFLFFLFVCFEVGSHSVGLTGLKLTEIPLPLPPKCWH